MLTPVVLRLLHSGCFYLGGRDKYYRPTIVQDAGKIATCVKSDPDIVTSEAFIQLFAFYYEYLTNVMFVPG